jgi:hypothetical protein
MKKVIAARFIDVRSFDKPGYSENGKLAEVAMGRNGQTHGVIRRIIEEANKEGVELSLYVVDGKAKNIIPTKDLIGDILQISDSPFCVEIEDSNKFNLCDIDDIDINEALVSKKGLNDLKKVASATKKVSKAGRTKSQGNLLDKNIETEIKTIYNESTIKRFNDFNEIDECLVPENSLRQLNDVRKISKSTDIGEKTRLKGPNMVYDRSALDGKVETYEDYVKSQKDYVQKNNKWVVK